MVLKRGGPLPAVEYLGFFVAEQDSGDVMDFCEEVVKGGSDAATWRISDCLVGVVEERRAGIGLTIERYIAALDGVAGERWFRLRQDDVPLWDRLPDVGPGTLIRGMRYWTPFDVPNRDAPIRRLRLDALEVDRVPDGDIDVAIRRWMATCAAWWARDYLLGEGPRATVAGIVAAYPEPVTPSADGLIALAALVREARSGDPRWLGQVGFIGPDDWYRAGGQASGQPSG